ncbi:MAG: hypothetical protein IT315_10250 [Anaerolineales bacterium]|nr:hypothetical protein [Anaerolineales bacterium]
MLHEKFLGVRLSELEEQALILWMKDEGIDKKSTMLRRVFRMALKNAPRSIFPPHILDALNLSAGEAQS